MQQYQSLQHFVLLKCKQLYRNILRLQLHIRMMELCNSLIIDSKYTGPLSTVMYRDVFLAADDPDP